MQRKQQTKTIIQQQQLQLNSFHLIRICFVWVGGVKQTESNFLPPTALFQADSLPQMIYLLIKYQMLC